MPSFTGIGSRTTPSEILELMEQLACHLALKGYTLRSGGADGADTAFERGCLNAGGLMRIYLPATGWNKRPKTEPYVVPDMPASFVIAAQMHPGWNYLPEFVRQLHARNVNQVLGDNLDDPAEFVVCWTPDGAITANETSKNTGGTGQAIRIANAYEVPVYNLFRPEHRKIIMDWMHKEHTMRTFKLSPSDFAFLWKECKRCYWFKYANGIPRPATPMAKIFQTIDGGMQRYFQDKILSEFDPTLPNIKVVGKNMNCTSEAMVFEDLGVQLYIHGKSDGAGTDLDAEGYVIVDYKTSIPKPEHLVIYSAQLHSYAYAFSKSAENANKYSPITRLGLLIYEPKEFLLEGLDATLQGSITWIEIPLDKKWFSGLLREVAELLSQPEPPDSDEHCAFCKYAQAMRVADAPTPV